MTPKEKAEKLIRKYWNSMFNLPIDIAKECALISVNNLIEEFDEECSTSIYYFKEVKLEIEKL
jgi:hypothetical protein